MSIAPESPTSANPMFAVFNGREEITEEMYKEVQSFAEHVKEPQKEKTAPEEPGRQTLLHN